LPEAADLRAVVVRDFAVRLAFGLAAFFLVAVVVVVGRIVPASPRK